MVQALIKKGVDIETANDYGSTPLIVSTYYNQADIIKLLVGAGAGLDAQDQDGNTALHYAVAFDFSDVSLILI